MKKYFLDSIKYFSYLAELNVLWLISSIRVYTIAASTHILVEYLVTPSDDYQLSYRDYFIKVDELIIRKGVCNTIVRVTYVLTLGLVIISLIGRLPSEFSYLLSYFTLVGLAISVVKWCVRKCKNEGMVLNDLLIAIKLYPVLIVTMVFKLIVLFAGYLLYPKIFMFLLVSVPISIVINHIKHYLNKISSYKEVLSNESKTQ